MVCQPVAQQHQHPLNCKEAALHQSLHIGPEKSLLLHAAVLHSYAGSTCHALQGPEPDGEANNLLAQPSGAQPR